MDGNWQQMSSGLGSVPTEEDKGCVHIRLVHIDDIHSYNHSYQQ